MFIKEIVFDLDDTLFATYPYFDQQLKSRGVDCQGHYITAKNGGSHFTEMLADASFMRDLPLHKGAFGTLLSLRHTDGVNLSACTHRGYHKDAPHYTSESLDRHGIKKFFNVVHFVNPAHHNDKLEYLRREFGHDDFILVDDKPIFDNSKPLPRNVLLRTQMWNSHIDHPYRISSMDPEEVTSVIRQMRIDLSARK